MMRTPLLVLAAGTLLLVGCSTTTRSVTHINWYDEAEQSSAYVAYWEGQCSNTGCERGDSYIKLCRVKEDNTLACEQQTEAEKLLNTHR